MGDRPSHSATAAQPPAAIADTRPEMRTARPPSSGPSSCRCCRYCRKPPRPLSPVAAGPRLSFARLSATASARAEPDGESKKQAQHRLLLDLTTDRLPRALALGGQALVNALRLIVIRPMAPCAASLAPLSASVFKWLMKVARSRFRAARSSTIASMSGGISATDFAAVVLFTVGSFMMAWRRDAVGAAASPNATAPVQRHLPLSPHC